MLINPNAVAVNLKEKKGRKKERSGLKRGVKNGCVNTCRGKNRRIQLKTVKKCPAYLRQLN